MKKIISLTLVLCMLLSAALTIGVSAQYTPPTDGIDNVTDLFDYSSITGLDAYYGSPVVDGTQTNGTMRDAVWDSTLPFENSKNSGTKFSILWDENGLYFLAERTTDTIKTNIKDSTASWYSGDNEWISYTFAAPAPIDSNTDILGYNIVVSTRLTTEDLATVGKVSTTDTTHFQYHTTVADNGGYGSINTMAWVKTYSEVTEDGYLSETFIPWKFVEKNIDSSAKLVGDETDATTIKNNLAGLDIGLKLKATGGSTHYEQMAASWTDSTNGNDGSSGVLMPKRHGSFVGYDPVRLCHPGTIVPDVKYWENAFASAAHATTEVYEIDTEAKLLGLAKVINRWTSNGTSIDATAISAATLGKTFKLTKDMKLNTHITDWSGIDADDAKNIHEEWPMMTYFYGTLDGDGHSLTGVYCYSYPYISNTGSTNHGMIGQLLNGGIKNIIIDNGFVGRMNRNLKINTGSGNDDRSNGFLVGIIPSGTEPISFENVYIGKNATIQGVNNMTGTTGNATQWIGGFIGENGGPITMTNCVFAGKLVGSTTYPNNMGGIVGWHKGAATLTNCYVLNSDSDYTASTIYGKKDNVTVTETNCAKYADEAAALESGHFINTTSKGALPLAMADYYAEYGIQATVAEGGAYNIRVIGEMAHKNYKSVDMVITLTKASDNTSASWGYGCTDKNGVEYQLSKTCYTSMLANNVPYTADTFNDDFIEGEDTALYALTFNGLSATESYTLSVKTVWTLTDGTVVEGTVAHTVGPQPFVPAAQQ